ncbi:MAG: chemotaxis protein CheW [Pseudomonadota bacterium]
MKDIQITVRCQIIPVHGDNLILPNTAVAEVIHYQDPNAVSGAPDWLLGLLTWRERPIPVASFEAACGQERPAPHTRAKIIVLNALSGGADLNFYGLVTQGLPQLTLIDERKIASVEHETETNPLVLSRVIVNDEPAVIPNLDVLEERLLACKKYWKGRG